MRLNLVLEQLRKEMTIRNYSPNTIENYVSVIRSFSKYIKELEIDEVDADILQIYFYYLKAERSFSYSSIKLYRAALQFLYKNILKQEIAFDVVVKMRKQEKLPEVLSVEEVQSLIAGTVNLKHKTILSLIYGCGLRISEAVNLKLYDIDRKRKMVRIEMAKVNKERYVMLSDNLIDLMARYYRHYLPAFYLFEGQGGKSQYSPRSIQSIFRAAKKRAGITQKVSVHTLRHSFATHLLDQGTDIRYIQELLGHKNLATTQIYTHISTYRLEKVKSPVERIDLSL
ncbi:MAG: site-specific integrase [Candidatus Marinimicrobia bacterium]|nr:site-specific integrase [Candidatus Neomarinimicrobiota bacterium]